MSFDKTWERLGEIPVDSEDQIEIIFHDDNLGTYPIGTDKFAIWSDIEDVYDISLGEWFSNHGGLNMKEYKLISIYLITGESKNFIGKYRRDLETNNWHYYEKNTGKLIHFRKEHMIYVDDEPENI